MTINHSVWKQLRWFALFLAVFVVAIAAAQYGYARYELNRSLRNQSQTWADEIIEQSFNGHWDLRRYNQASPNAPEYITISNDGFIDIEEGQTYIRGFAFSGRG